MQVHIIPDIQNLVLQLTSTLILFLIVRHFLYKPATELLAARSDKVYEEMAETKKQKEEAEATKREYEARLDQAKEESRTIVENAKQRGEQLKDEIIQEAKAEGLDVSGPIPPDTVFLKALQGSWDIVVAMYHDQGHIPLKMLSFENGVSITVGLDVIRTSVDHGTAFDIAGKLIASEKSLLEAIEIGERL